MQTPTSRLRRTTSTSPRSLRSSSTTQRSSCSVRLRMRTMMFRSPRCVDWLSCDACSQACSCRAVLCRVRLCHAPQADILKNLTEALDFTVAPAHTLPDGVPLLKVGPAALSRVCCPSTDPLCPVVVQFLYMDLLQAVAPQSKIAVDFPSSLYSL